MPISNGFLTWEQFSDEYFLELGLDRPETYEQLRQNIERSRDELKSLLLDLKNRGKSVAGYAATSKSTTITNYCGLASDLVEFISDTTPIKQGKYSPGFKTTPITTARRTTRVPTPKPRAKGQALDFEPFAVSLTSDF